MIVKTYRDKHSLIVDSTGDAGDSAHKAGTCALYGSDEPLVLYYYGNGLVRRHPLAIPWNNYKNFSRDQLMMYMAGLWEQGNTQLAREVFKAHAKRFFFCQNIERDYAGSRKYPYPHAFINDKGIKETRLFDFADPLLPDDIVFLALCCRYSWAELLRPILQLSTFIEIAFDSGDIHVEKNNLMAACKLLGPAWVESYKNLVPSWKARLYYYWVDRRESKSIFDLIVENF